MTKAAAKSATSQKAPKVLKEGAKAPAFSMPTDGGGKIASKDLEGQNIVLYFYPKDDTSGCTKEAIGFTQALADFEAHNTVIIGVSKDTIAKHDKFKAKHDLGVILGSDEDGKVLEKYGVWVEKKLYGKVYMGIERATFLINEDGKIVKIWRKVRVPGHVEAVLEAVSELAGQ